ncbi:hypothetical protein GIB67_042485 [Kingdonia uniflora]|uniref:Uncharacterized protein n=1 Tax=Kingdonia uniflora TaxID=39325 RepID=A0A7J7M0W9_9MAGN|nr:hypothetical protein GIB67_042485 [Kingdonia uniflora]
MEIVVQRFSEGPIFFPVNSWIQSRETESESRIIFRNQAYLPLQTPDSLKDLRREDLLSARGNGKDLYSESRIENPDPVYVPRDETFEETKEAYFSASRLKAVFHNLLPSLAATFSNEDTPFTCFTEIDKLYNYGILVKHNEDQKDIFEKLLLSSLIKKAVNAGEDLFKYSILAIISRDRFSWLRDNEFTRQALAGVNSINIEKLKEFSILSKLDPVIYGPPESLITKELIDQELEVGVHGYEVGAVDRYKNNYKTMDINFMESVWWVFSQLFDKGLVYRGFKVMPYNTGCKTSPSKFEANSNYKIADAVGAFRMMDMAHINGLVVVSVVANSFEYCDVVTTTTHKGPEQDEEIKKVEREHKTITLFIVGVLQKSELESAICVPKCGEWQNLRSKSTPATDSTDYTTTTTVSYHPPIANGPPLQPRQPIIGMGREDQGYWGGSGDHEDNNMCFEDRCIPSYERRGRGHGVHLNNLLQCPQRWFSQ